MSRPVLTDDQLRWLIAGRKRYPCNCGHTDCIDAPGQPRMLTMDMTDIMRLGIKSPAAFNAFTALSRDEELNPRCVLVAISDLELWLDQQA